MRENTMNILLERIYDHSSTKGYRVLVDRLWPRGVSKSEAKLDDWWKDLAPSDKLRRWYGHDSEKWGEFRKSYLKELKSHRERARELKSNSRTPLILLYGAKTKQYTHAKVLREYLQRLK